MRTKRHTTAVRSHARHAIQSTWSDEERERRRRIAARRQQALWRLLAPTYGRRLESAPAA